MTATISLDSLWATIQSMSRKNKEWLSERLIQDLNQDEHQETEEEILAAIGRALKEVKEGKCRPIEELWDQL